MTSVLYPGSFDPIHNGHLDLITTAAQLFDRVHVVAMVNREKTGGFFELDEREAIIVDSTAHLPEVVVSHASGLVIDVAAELGVDSIIKGLRGITDFDIEMQMAQTNSSVSGVPTLFLPTAPEQAFVSSRFIREIAQFGGNVDHLVPPRVAARLQERTAG